MDHYEAATLWCPTLGIPHTQPTSPIPKASETAEMPRKTAMAASIELAKCLFQTPREETVAKAKKVESDRVAAWVDKLSNVPCDDVHKPRTDFAKCAREYPTASKARQTRIERMYDDWVEYFYEGPKTVNTDDYAWPGSVYSNVY